MHFSCKVSNAVLSYLEAKGEDISPLYDLSPIPWEMLRDPSNWMSAPDMEFFLGAALKLQLTQTTSSENILQQAGHQGPQILAWGVLESVLRMMPRPQEIFNQPERFLSYFISPQPPIENLKRDANGIAFDLPLPAEQYPLVTAYLKAAFESLPLYVGQGLAQCEWQGIRLKIIWPEQQETIFQSDPGHQISPELLQKVIEGLQKHQQDLEEKNRDLQNKNEELSRTYQELKMAAPQSSQNMKNYVHDFHFDISDPGYILGQNLARLHDYMVRAQQLVTVLASQTKMNPSLKGVMRRIDWDFVKAQYPRTIAESVEVLRRMQREIHNQQNEEEKLSSPQETFYV